MNAPFPSIPRPALASKRKSSRSTLDALAAGLSQAGLAARAGLTQSHVALIEGGRNDPTTGTVVKIARVLGVNEQLVFRAIRARLERAD